MNTLHFASLTLSVAMLLSFTGCASAPLVDCEGGQCAAPVPASRTPIVVEDAETTRTDVAPTSDIKGETVAQFDLRRPTGARLPAIHNLQEALAKAKAEDKLLFIQYGREECSNCQKIWDLLGCGDVKLPDNMLYADVSCDDSDVRLFVESNYSINDAGIYLPYIFIVAPDGSQLDSSSGLYTPEFYRDMIKRAVETEAMPMPTVVE